MSPKTQGSKKRQKLAEVDAGDADVVQLLAQFECASLAKMAKFSPAKRGLLVDEWRKMKNAPPYKSVYNYVETQPKSIMHDHANFAAAAADAVMEAQKLLDILDEADGKKRAKPRKAKFVGDLPCCVHCEIVFPHEAMMRHVVCLACSKQEKAEYAATPFGQLNQLVQCANVNHDFGLTVRQVLVKMIKLEGWCGINHVLPLSFDRQSPFYMSIENMRNDAVENVDKWVVSCSISNTFANIADDDLRALLTGEALPGGFPREMPPKLASRAHGTCACGQPKHKKCGYCQLCQQIHNKLNSAYNDLKKCDKGVSGTMSKSEYLELDKIERCTISDFPFFSALRGTKHFALARSIDRIENRRGGAKLPHSLANCRPILALFNCSDGNAKRESQGSMPPAGLNHPYSYSWTRDDVAIFVELLRKHFSKE